MEYKILFTEDALADLEVLLSYIRSGNDAAAERLGRALLSHVELLHDFPRLGVTIANRGGVRMMVHFPIRIYYRINSKRLGAELDGSEYWHVAVFCSERATGELKLNRLTAIVHPGNHASVGVLKKLGFRAEGLAISLAMSVNVWALTPDMVKNRVSTH